MFNYETYKRSLKDLKSLLYRTKSDQRECIYLGICHNLDFSAKVLFDEIIPDWPKYSGNSIYPIPGYRTTSSSEWAYNRGNLWSGYKLKLRIEALEFVISELEYRSSYW